MNQLAPALIATGAIGLAAAALATIAEHLDRLDRRRRARRAHETASRWPDFPAGITRADVDQEMTRYAVRTGR